MKEEEIKEDIEVEDTKEEEKVETQTTEEEKNSGESTNYVKKRVDRAKNQKEKEILQELGVNDLGEAKEVINQGQKALNEVMELKSKIEAQEQEAILKTKKQNIIKLLDNEKVFDSEALANYVDLDKVKMEDGMLLDTENIIASLKKVKPNFFGTYEISSDNYVKGSSPAPKTSPLEKQKQGDTMGAMVDYLDDILKQ